MQREIETQGRAAVRAIVAKADRDRARRDRRRRAVARVVRALHAASPHRPRWHRLAADAFRSRRLSAIQGELPAARDHRRPGLQSRASAQGDRRDPLQRSVVDRSRVRGLSRRARRAEAASREAFLTAPSPGIIASIVQNEHYDTFERYLDALAAALQVEYEAIVRNGFLLQLDCPDLALERHTSYRDRPLADFVAFVEMVVAAINKARAKHPARENPAACVLGQLRRSARPRRRAARHSSRDPEGEGRRDLPAVRQPAPCA